MSDYEVIMLLLQVLAIVIAFGALVALIWGYRTKRVGTLIPIIER